MPLAPAQKTLLRNHINASSDLNVFPNSNDGNIEVSFSGAEDLGPLTMTGFDLSLDITFTGFILD